MNMCECKCMLSPVTFTNVEGVLLCAHIRVTRFCNMCEFKCMLSPVTLTNVLQCVAVCCSVLQSVAECCSVLQNIY